MQLLGRRTASKRTCDATGECSQGRWKLEGSKMLGHQPSMCRAGKPPAVHGRQVLSGVVRQNMLPQCITSASFCAALRHICVIQPGDTPQCNATANRKPQGVYSRGSRGSGGFASIGCAGGDAGCELAGGAHTADASVHGAAVLSGHAAHVPGCGVAQGCGGMWQGGAGMRGAQAARWHRCKQHRHQQQGDTSGRGCYTYPASKRQVSAVCTHSLLHRK